MKIAVSSSNDNGFNSEIDSRFGRAPYFAIVDTEKMDIEVVDNPATSSSHGAGVQAAQVISEQEVEAVIAGNIGPKAFQALQGAGLKLYSFEKGSIKDAVETWQKGELEELENSTTNSHSGTR